MGLSEKEKKKFELNIILNYIIGALMWGRFFIPVLALFYIASQVPLEQFAIIMSVFAFTTLILEVPTGVLADLLGKKKTLLISRLMYVFEIIIIAFFNGFWPFLIAKVISGIGVSLGSGTTEALLYDSLKKLKKEKEYKRISGKKSFISNFSMAFTFIIGAYLFTLSPKLPAIVSLFPITLGLILTFFLTEPNKPSKALTMANSWKHLNEGLSLFFKNPYLKYFALLTLSVGSAIEMMLSFSAAYYSEILIPVSLIGVVAFVTSMLIAYSSKKAHIIENSLGEKKSIFLMQAIIFSGIFLMSFMFPYWGIIFFLAIPLVKGFFSVVLGDYVNYHVKTSHRATMLSINNMSDNIGIFILFPILGIITKNYSMGIALFGFSIFLLVYFIISDIYYGKISKNN